MLLLFFFQAEDGIRDLVRSRGLGDVYKRQALRWRWRFRRVSLADLGHDVDLLAVLHQVLPGGDCLLYTSDAADDLLCVDLGGRRIIQKKKKKNQHYTLQQSVQALHTSNLHTSNITHSHTT